MTALNDPSNVAFANPKAWALHDKAILEFKDLKTQELAIKHIEHAISIAPKNALLWQEKAAFCKAFKKAKKRYPALINQYN
jgi:hypothetical protein